MLLYYSSDNQQDLNYARWAEIKHGRIAMLAIVGILVQQAGIHLPGAQYSNPDIFGAPKTVGWGANIQIFLFMCLVEILTFNKTYSGDEPGDFGLDGGMLKSMSADQIKYRKESEIVHGRLAMIAVVAAVTHTLLFGKAIPF
jgi:light-harvesting complex I chlorophyll a/b binding protein 1